MKIFFVGFMGCGKTHWGKAVAQKLGLPFFDLDTKIEEDAGKNISQIFEEEGEEAFRRREKEVLYLLSESHASFVMACGGGTPCYYNNIDYMKGQGTTIWINCSVDCLHSRLIREKTHRPLIADLDNDGLRSFIVKKFGDRKIFYQQAAIILNEDDVQLDPLIDRIFHTSN
ncbi:MAG: shikimate kinase [Flaviaesturariibacter sp.]|nr:shikimate kinase [Flaviaesturariibacter sp.]